jgi:Uma2 family endonuclease
VIEVSVSSQRRDLVRKPRIYAEAGVDEYWVVDLDNRRVVCHRDPRGDTYHEITEFPADGTLTAAAVELPALAVAELLAAAER